MIYSENELPFAAAGFLIAHLERKGVIKQAELLQPLLNYAVATAEAGHGYELMHLYRHLERWLETADVAYQSYEAHPFPVDPERIHRILSQELQ